MKKILAVLTIAALLAIAAPSLVSAATTADIAVTATPQYISISVNVSSYDFGTVAVSDTPSTLTNHFGIDNTSGVQTDQTISTNSTVWNGGAGWTHSDLGTPGADQAGMKANNATWGVGDIIIKNAAPNYIAENQAAGVDYYFGLKLWAPTSFSDSVQKGITVRVSAVAG